MSQPKNSLTIALMLSSIGLLFVLQGFWLKSVYEEAAANFRRETNFLFRNTIFSMHDSLIQRSIEAIPGDSVIQKNKPKRIIFKDSFTTDEPLADSNVKYFNLEEKTARIEVFLTGDKTDSIQKILRPLVTKIQMDKNPQNFIIRLGPDSLEVDSIKLQYKQALAKAGINANFQVIAIKHQHGSSIKKVAAQPKETFTSEFVPLNPMNGYAVNFSGIEGLLLKEITPQIIFSLFLSLLTTASFYIMYKSIRSQQRLMEIKNDFISNITHELKTPVATVSVALEALKNFNALDDPKRTSEYLEIAQMELNRLTLMTDKILKTSLFEDKGVEIKLEEVNVDILVQEVLNSMKLVFEKRKTVLTYQKEGTDFFAASSKEHLTNVLYNLVDNALKYSSERSFIHISLTSNSNKIVLRVKDSGIGILPEYQKKIFEKFFRIPTGDIHNTKGYGLGLSYVASVVKSNGGEITVESEPEEGSCFIVTLPKRHEN